MHKASTARCGCGTRRAAEASLEACRRACREYGGGGDADERPERRLHAYLRVEDEAHEGLEEAREDGVEAERAAYGAEAVVDPGRLLALLLRGICRRGRSGIRQGRLWLSERVGGWLCVVITTKAVEAPALQASQMSHNTH
jgi:hypothetical protein